MARAQVSESDQQNVPDRPRRCAAERGLAARLGGVYVEDFVLGANDGIITSFAVVAGATGGELGVAVVLILGFANLFADSVSMGASCYLAKRSGADYLRSRRATVESQIVQQPEEKRAELERYAEQSGVSERERDHVIHSLTRSRKLWADILMCFGAGLGGENGQPWKHGLSTLFAFLLAGSFPLLPYVLRMNGNRFLLAVVAATITLFVAGALRTLVTGANWLRSGIEMLLVGSAAGAIAYGVGHAVAAIAGTLNSTGM